MKNFVQTPKQRRIQMTQQKQNLKASKPVIQFRQETRYKDYGWTVTRLNLVHHIKGRK